MYIYSIPVGGYETHPHANIIIETFLAMDAMEKYCSVSQIHPPFANKPPPPCIFSVKSCRGIFIPSPPLPNHIWLLPKFVDNYVWQSRVEMGGYSVVHFECITMLEALYH